MPSAVRIRKLRPFSWMVFLVAALVMVIITVPGLVVLGRPTLQFPSSVQRQLTNKVQVTAGPPQFIQEFAHGWPCT